MNTNVTLLYIKTWKLQADVKPKWKRVPLFKIARDKWYVQCRLAGFVTKVYKRVILCFIFQGCNQIDVKVNLILNKYCNNVALWKKEKKVIMSVSDWKKIIAKIPFVWKLGWWRTPYVVLNLQNICYMPVEWVTCVYLNETEEGFPCIQDNYTKAYVISGLDIHIIGAFRWDDDEIWSPQI